jgi:hypothetical protein
MTSLDLSYYENQLQLQLQLQLQRIVKLDAEKNDTKRKASNVCQKLLSAYTTLDNLL